MKLTKETVAKIANIYWCNTNSDDEHDYEILVKLLKKLDFTPVAGYTQLRLVKTDDPYAYSPGIGD